MAIVLQQHTLSQTTTLGVNTATFAGTTAGNMIIVAITYFGGGSDTFSSIVGTSDSYTQIGSTLNANATSDYVRLYYAKNINGGLEAVAVTFTGSPGSGDTMVAIFEYSGASTTAPLDTTNPGTTGSGITPAPGAVDPTVNNCLVFSVGADDNGNNATPTANTGAGFVLEEHQDDSSSHERIYTEDLIQTSHVSVNASYTIGTGSNWAVQTGVFKPAVVASSRHNLLLMGAGT